MNKLASLLTALSLSTPCLSFATDWTSVCSAGATIDETSLTLYQVNNASLGFRPSTTGGPGTGVVTARYNVTNTAVPSTPKPSWTTFELGYFDNSTSSAVVAILYQVRRCNGEVKPICRIASVDAERAICEKCEFPETTFDFSTFLYYIQVNVSRSKPDVLPRANTLRIF
ncbi:MAG: hypothetical protein ABR589_05370 [Chthoniobacterales bacterium]